MMVDANKKNCGQSASPCQGGFQIFPEASGGLVREENPMGIISTGNVAQIRENHDVAHAGTGCRMTAPAGPAGNPKV